LQKEDELNRQRIKKQYEDAKSKRIQNAINLLKEKREMKNAEKIKVLTIKKDHKEKDRKLFMNNKTLCKTLNNDFKKLIENKHNN